MYDTRQRPGRGFGNITTKEGSAVSSPAGCLLALVVFATPALAAPPTPRDGKTTSQTGKTKELRTAAPTIGSGACPGTGDCCAANGTPGCEDSDCCQLVCAQDAFCCSAGWDGLCAGLAEQLCGELCVGTLPCPGPGNCCQPNGTPGCTNQACCELVCAEDRLCCDSASGWDALCVVKAETLCGALCSADPCPGQGDCCEPNGTPGCSNQSCCELVCADDPACCDVANGWDALCASKAQSLCTSLCSATNCPGTGDCCQATGTAGCNDASCCDIVCMDDPTCCDPTTGWDSPCVAKAEALCGPLCSCPGEGDCCQPKATAGCNDPSCCDLVCTDDPTCCDPATGWGSPCVAKAEALCGPLCSCPGEGDCCQPNATAGCNDPSCCDLVCTDDPTCCDPATGWGSPCVTKAEALCDPLCSGNACPGDGDCCQANGTAGCTDQACCEVVCANDPDCCEPFRGWDGLCVSQAESLCGTLCSGNACPGDGDCCQANGTAGCTDQACCDAVCAVDPDCCESFHGWDGLCASQAESLCGTLCLGNACPGQGVCCQANGSPGCEDPECCNVVCANDALCCDLANGWDSLCAQSAQNLCNICGNQACCFINGNCADLAAESCVGQGGTPLGPGSLCNGSCGNAIPTMSEWGVVVIYLLLVIGGTLVIMVPRRETRCPSRK